MSEQKTNTSHWFLDEAGDTTFFGKGKVNLIGTGGVSNSFILGAVIFNSDLNVLRKDIRALQKQIETDAYFSKIHSINKKKITGGFYFHGSDDIPEVRKLFFEFIKKTDCKFEAVVGRKIPELYEKKHNAKGNEFYADLLSHLLKDKFYAQQRLVLNLVHRKNSTENTYLEKALTKATTRFRKDNPKHAVQTKIVFNVQTQQKEPLLNIADYFCWTIQRVFEKGEDRFYDYIKEKIEWVVDLYDLANHTGNKHYYTKKNPLTAKNKLSPSLP